MTSTELKVLNSVLQTKDIKSVFSENINELFVGYPDVWSYIREYYMKYRTVPDASLLTDRFRGFEVVDAPGETAYWVDQLREEFMKNRLDQISGRIGASLGSKPSKEILQKSIAALMKLNDLAVESEDLDITDFHAAEESIRETRMRAEALGGTPGIPTGISFLDASYPSGLVGGDLIVVLGWTGRAKSLLTTMVACNAFNQGYKPMIISLEMKTTKVRNRAYTMLGKGRWRNSSFDVGNIDEDDFRQWGKGFSDKSGFVVVSHSGDNEITPAVIQSKIDQHKPDLIVLDYAQLMSDNANSTDMTSRMRNMSKEFKRLAVANDIPIILISSATPDGTTSTATPPIVEQVAWSKQLSYDADLAFAVHRHDLVLSDGAVIIEVVGRKNRNGELFCGYFKANIDAGIYEEFYDLADIAA